MNHPIHPGPGACFSELLQYVAELAENQLDSTSTLSIDPALIAMQHAIEDLQRARENLRLASLPL